MTSTAVDETFNDFRRSASDLASSRAAVAETDAALAITASQGALDQRQHLRRRGLTDVISRGSEVFEAAVDKALVHLTASRPGTGVGGLVDSDFTDASAVAVFKTPVPVVPPHPIPEQPPGASFQALQKWEGRVLERADTWFSAVLSDLSDGVTEEEAEFDLAEVSTDDHHLVVPGAVFYWNVGYRTEPSGERSRQSVIWFRRLPSWSARDLARLEHRVRSLRDQLRAPR
jgi:hypothetical protein